MTDYLPLPITDNPHNTRHPSKFIPKNFPAPLLEALDTLKARGIRIDLCSSYSVLDNRISEFNIVCGHDQIILPDDIPETCECIYVYKKSDRWMVSRIDPIYEKFTPLIFVKKNRTRLDAMYGIDNSGATETELICLNLEADILQKAHDLQIPTSPRYKYYRYKSAEQTSRQLAMAINSLNYRRISKAYHDFLDSVGREGIANHTISEGVPEFKSWLKSEIIRISEIKGPIKHDDSEAERRDNYLERLGKSL